MEAKKAVRYKVIKNEQHPKAGKNGFVYEHFIVAEKILGRHLKDGETVHHIDENKRNNSLDNIMVFATKSDHVHYHNGASAWSNDGIIWKSSSAPKFKTCAYCHKPYIVDCLKKNKKYCSKKCKNADSHNYAKMISIQNELFSCNGNFSNVARNLNVSSSGLAKLLKENGLCFYSSDYRTFMGD